MQFNPILSSARLIKRYKRFLADIQLPDGTIETIYCPNTGAMTGCADEGTQIWYSISDNQKRKYPKTWELSVTDRGDWICINTLRANQIVVDGIKESKIKEFNLYQSIKTEVPYG